MRQRSHLGEELRRVLHRVGDFGAARLESSGAEFLEFGLAAVVLAIVVAGVVVAATVVFVLCGGRRRVPGHVTLPLVREFFLDVPRPWQPPAAGMQSAAEEA